MLAMAPAALPRSPMNAVSLPRLGAAETASQVLRPWQGAAFGSLPGLSISIPDSLTLSTQLGPFSLIYIK
jgi:hypothetical protein